MRQYLIPVFCAILLFSGGIATDANGQGSTAEAQKHVAAARAATFRPLHDLSVTFDTMCRAPQPPQPAAQTTAAAAAPEAPRGQERSEWYAEPVKVFDNLYYVGSSYENNQAAWAVTTSEGIILIDSAYDYTVEELVTKNFKKIGLDPTQIKYVILHHAHGDRYFGSKYLQNTYKARLIMTEADWDVMVKGNEPAELKPRKDMVATDGMKLTLGDTTLTLYVTPGHTPGTISTLVPLKDGNQRHLGWILGGQGWSEERYGVRYYPNPQEAIRVWSDSIKRFHDIGAKAGADVFLPIHPQHDQTFQKFTALRFRQPGAPHPWVSKEFIQNYTTVMLECMQAQLAWRKTGTN